MRIEMRKRTPGDIDIGLVYSGILVLALFACRFLPVLDLAPSCSFKMYSGISCPTCGTTRSFVHFADGRFAAAFAANPLVAAGIAAAIPFFFYRLIGTLTGAGGVKITLSAGEQRALIPCLVVLFLLNWIYLIIYL